MNLFEDLMKMTNVTRKLLQAGVYQNVEFKSFKTNTSETEDGVKSRIEVEMKFGDLNHTVYLFPPSDEEIQKKIDANKKGEDYNLNSNLMSFCNELTTYLKLPTDTSIPSVLTKAKELNIFPTVWVTKQPAREGNRVFTNINFFEPVSRNTTVTTTISKTNSTPPVTGANVLDIV